MIVIFLPLRKLNLTLIIHFYLLWAGYSYSNEIGQDVRPQKTIQALSVDKKFKTHAEVLEQVTFNDSIGQNQKLGLLVNK